MILKKIYRKIKGIIQRPNCIMAPSAVLYETARIINILGDPEAIKIGAFTHVRGELLTFAHGGRITVGEFCYIGDHTRIWSAKQISLGNRVLISHNVNIFDNLTHPISPKARHEQFKQTITSGHPRVIDLKERPVTIADDVLIGCSAVILPGVIIGEGAIVGAGAVVTKDVRPYCIVAGNPAQVIREIPPDER